MSNKTSNIVSVWHKTAIIGYCPDLTDPDAVSEPVGVLKVGYTGARPFAALSVLGPLPEGLDEITKSILRDGLYHQLVALIPEKSEDSVHELYESAVRLVSGTLHVMNNYHEATWVLPVLDDEDLGRRLFLHYCATECPRRGREDCSCPGTRTVEESSGGWWLGGWDNVVTWSTPEMNDGAETAD